MSLSSQAFNAVTFLPLWKFLSEFPPKTFRCILSAMYDLSNLESLSKIIWYNTEITWTNSHKVGLNKQLWWVLCVGHTDRSPDGAKDKVKQTSRLLCIKNLGKRIVLILGISFKSHLWPGFGLVVDLRRVSSCMQLQLDQSSSQTDNILAKEKCPKKGNRCHVSALDGSSASTLLQDHD